MQKNEKYRPFYGNGFKSIKSPHETKGSLQAGNIDFGDKTWIVIYYGKKTNFINMKQNHLKSILIKAAIITVSSTRTRENDTSGKTIDKILKSAGIQVEYYSIVFDQIEAIRAEIYKALEKSNCLIINGGTGLTYDDCTIEAVLPLLDKKIDGFGELFRTLSYKEIGTASMLSRALAGTCHGKIIFCVPGSTAAVTLATQDLIIPEIAHILSHANK